MIDWDKDLHAAVHGVFGEAVTYRFADGDPAVTLIDAVFTEHFRSVDALIDPGTLSRWPVLGVRLSALPAGYDPEQAQGDTFTLLRTGATYIVRSGRPDGQGWAMLEANKQ